MTFDSDSLIYLASPYSHKDKTVEEHRYKEAMRACAWLANNNYLVYSPIVHWHLIAKEYKMPTDFMFWRKLNHRTIDSFQEVCVLSIKGWDESNGVKDEIAYAEQVGKKVWYLTPVNNTYEFKEPYYGKSL